MPGPLYTIGHSNHPIEHVIGLLQQHRITALCDVRSTPYSRYGPHFDREAFKASLHTAGIAYVFFGKELGARSDDPRCYLHGKVQFQRIAETPLFRAGLERVERGMQHHRLALMCAEKEPLDCHRTILVARRLAERGADIHHILANGELETHEAALRRLAELLGLREAEQHLFRSREDLIADAYTLQERRIAYDSADSAHDAKAG